MRAAEVQGAFGIDNLNIVQKADPSPGPRQVLVRMKAGSLNYRDLVSVTGLMQMGLKLPYVPLSDGAGEVVEVGPGVQRFKAGDRVTPAFFENWLGGEARREWLATARAGALVGGVMQELVVVHEDGLVATPAHLSDREAATLPCAGLTAWRAVVVEGQIKPGDTVLVQGTGGVSIFALQFAKAAGAEVIATSASDEKLARASALGADHVINYVKEPRWAKRAREITNGRGVDQVIEVGGAETFQQSLEAVKLGGHISVIGLLSGGAKELSMIAIMMSNAHIKGISVGSRQSFEDMNRAISQSKIRPVVDKVFALKEARQAFATMKDKAHFGKIVVDVAA